MEEYGASERGLFMEVSPPPLSVSREVFLNAAAAAAPPPLTPYHP